MNTGWIWPWDLQFVTRETFQSEDLSWYGPILLVSETQEGSKLPGLESSELQTLGPMCSTYEKEG